MSNPRVRVLGEVAGVHGIPLAVGVDYDAVTLNGVQLGPEVRDDFARPYFAADEAAKAYAAAHPEEPECLAPHCPPSASVDCEYPKCAPGVSG